MLNCTHYSTYTFMMVKARRSNGGLQNCSNENFWWLEKSVNFIMMKVFTIMIYTMGELEGLLMDKK